MVEAVVVGYQFHAKVLRAKLYLASLAFGSRKSFASRNFCVKCENQLSVISYQLFVIYN